MAAGPRTGFPRYGFPGPPRLKYTFWQMRISLFAPSIASQRHQTRLACCLVSPILCCCALLLFLAASRHAAAASRHAAAQAKAHHLLIYSIDVEGGQSTLLVSPSGNSLLVDTGWLGNNGRDADRIQAAMRDAGVTRIDHLLITHYHVDHVGGVPELAKRVSIGEFLDHGPNREDSDVTRRDYATYIKAIEGKTH